MGRKRLFRQHFSFQAKEIFIIICHYMPENIFLPGAGIKQHGRNPEKSLCRRILLFYIRQGEKSTVLY